MGGRLSSEFLHHEPCPKCGSSDALAAYDDGHKYCFSCKHYVRATATQQYRKQLKKEQSGNAGNLTLPNDFTVDIPQEGLTWLTKYIRIADVVAHRFGWSPNGFMIGKKTPNPFLYSPLLIIPIFDVYENLLMWQARYFGSNPRAPKYWTRGYKEDVLHILGKGDTIVLVEDILSCIRVSKFTSCMPVFGSSVNNNIITRIKDRFKNVVLWLDKDKRDYCYRRAPSLQPLFNRVTVVSSECDPKEYSDEEIATFLASHIR